MKKLLHLLICVSLLAGAGCSKKKSADAHAGHGHPPGSAHAHQPLMGGELVGIGEHQFNLEFKYDAARGVLLAWILDGHAVNFIRVSMALFDVQEAGGQQRTITLRALANERSEEHTSE